MLPVLPSDVKSQMRLQEWILVVLNAKIQQDDAEKKEVDPGDQMEVDNDDSVNFQSIRLKLRPKIALNVPVTMMQESGRLANENRRYDDPQGCSRCW